MPALPLDSARSYLDTFEAVLIVQAVHIAVSIERRGHEKAQLLALPENLRLLAVLVEPDRLAPLPVTGDQQHAGMPDGIADGDVVGTVKGNLPEHLAAGRVESRDMLRGPIDEYAALTDRDHDWRRVAGPVR